MYPQPLSPFPRGRSIPCSYQQQAVQGKDFQDYFNYQVKITHQLSPHSRCVEQEVAGGRQQAGAAPATQDLQQLELHGCLTPACPTPGSGPKAHRGLRAIILLRAHLPSRQILPQEWQEEDGESLLAGNGLRKAT